MGCGMRIRYSGLGIHQSNGKNQHQKSEHHDDRKQPDGFAHELATSGRTLYMARTMFAICYSPFALRFSPLAFLNSLFDVIPSERAWAASRGICGVLDVQNFLGVIRSAPTYGRSTSGITTLPSACW